MKPTSLRATLIALVVFVVAAVQAVPLPAQQTRLLTVDDIFALKSVGDPRISPDGQWVAFTVSQMDAEKDSTDTDIYMAPLDGGEAIRLTTSDKPESSPRWSPDGRYLAFLSGRDGKKSQVWLLPRHGGEAFKLTDYKTGVSSMAWSADGKRLALVVSDAKPEAEEGGEGEEAEEGGEHAGKAPEPIVVTRLQFKRDGVGYLNDLRRHIYVFDVDGKESAQVTDGPYDDGSPVWSPDGHLIAFVSNRTEEPDANDNSDIFVVEASAGSRPRPLTSSPGTDSSPAFSPDGKLIAYVAGGDPKDVWYDTDDVAVVPVVVAASSDTDGGGVTDQPRILTAGLDRNVGRPTFNRDGAAVLFALEDQGNRHLARVPLAGGTIERLVAGERTIITFDRGPEGEIVVLESQLNYPPEISRAEGGSLTRITHVNDAFLAGIELAPVERFRARSKDGTMIDAFLTRPPNAPAGQRLPTILRIHGGPVSQFSNRFSFEWQILAAHGYGVVAANPRGSSGRGRDFSYAIWADWGHKDYEDVMAAVDEAIAIGVADPERLGVGGWSYGGILTDHVITQTGRFKAAISGASEVNYTANYGHDHYQREWEGELGLPWENTDLWIRLSPFFKVDRITTPTLLMGGQVDWNVPLQNSEQLYQALRRLGVDTELVIYPGQSHGIRRPSYQKDRYQRYIAWYDKYLKDGDTTSGESRSKN
ncbi:MAG: S9 family peptidase [Acidobacteriota bacterium]